jgi:hypothetical protein
VADGTAALRSQRVLWLVIVLCLVLLGVEAGVCVWLGASTFTLVGYAAIVICSGYGAACRVAILNEEHRGVAIGTRRETSAATARQTPRMTKSRTPAGHATRRLGRDRARSDRPGRR